MIGERKLRGREGGGREGNRVGVEVRELMRGKMGGRVGKREIGREIGRGDGRFSSYHCIPLINFSHNSNTHLSKIFTIADPGSEILLLQPFGGDESGCVKPWLGAVKTPKNPPPINPGVPAVDVELKWIHGYTSGTPCQPTCFFMIQ